MEKNREKAWDQNYVTDQKWWTRLVCNVDSVCTKWVHHFPVRDVVLIPGLLPIFLHGCEIKSGSGLGTRLPTHCECSWRVATMNIFISLLRWAHFLSVMTASLPVLLSWWWHESVEGFSMLVSVPDPKPTSACVLYWSTKWGMEQRLFSFHSPSQWKPLVVLSHSISCHKCLSYLECGMTNKIKVITSPNANIINLIT